jgi:hypothetical protein
MTSAFSPERTVRLRKGNRVVRVDLQGGGPLAVPVSELPREARATVPDSINAQCAKNARSLTELASCTSALFNFQRRPIEAENCGVRGLRSGFSDVPLP